MLEIKRRMDKARRRPRDIEVQSKKDLGKSVRKEAGQRKKLGWKTDTAGYRSCAVDWRIWGKRSSTYGTLSGWFVICGWEIHVIRVFAGKTWYWRGVAFNGNPKYAERNLVKGSFKAPKGTSDAKALNEMFRERLKVTFKIGEGA